MWFIRGNLVRDVAALNKAKLLPWDVCGLAATQDNALTVDDVSVLNHATAVSATDLPDFAALHALAADDRFHVPQVIGSCVNDSVRKVNHAE